MKTGIAGKVAQAFIDSKLTPLLMVTFLAIGIYGTMLTPREEEPQIDVPTADIFIGYPGAGSKEVESRVAIPVEKMVSNIEGVEYVYSVSMPGKAMITARFYVGEDVERSLVKLYNEIIKHMDRMPDGVTQPLVKTRSIDDVPIMTLTLRSEAYSDYEIRRVADELVLEIKKIQDVAGTSIQGGRTREVRVQLDKNKMASYRVDPLQIASQIQQANQQLQSGSFSKNDEQYLVETGNFFRTAEEVGNLVVDVRNGEPIYLKAVAQIIDGPEEPVEYVSYGLGKKEAREYNSMPGKTY
ncbi:MAG: efflux RND transporter permease subunit, partial [Balneola sp.]